MKCEGEASREEGWGEAAVSWLWAESSSFYSHFISFPFRVGTSFKVWSSTGHNSFWKIKLSLFILNTSSSPYCRERNVIGSFSKSDTNLKHFQHCSGKKQFSLEQMKGSTAGFVLLSVSLWLFRSFLYKSSSNTFYISSNILACLGSCILLDKCQHDWKWDGARRKNEFMTTQGCNDVLILTTW